MTTEHRFDESLPRGHAGERAVAMYLQSRGHVVAYVTEAHRQRLGMDLEVTTPGGDRLTVEVKTDYRAGQTRRAFIEAISNVEGHRMGWAFTCRAQFLAIYVPADGDIYWLRPYDLATACGPWTEKHLVVHARNRCPDGSTYTTRGVAVPLEALRLVALRVDRINEPLTGATP